MNVLTEPAPASSPGAARGGATATLLIATYNRAALLEKTLQTAAALDSPPDVTWDVVVVDNNSTDATRDVVAAAAAWFPVPLTYVFEARQGKAVALNTGLAATSSSIVLLSDDDVRLPPEWLESAMRPLIERPEIAYVGGPVRPLWDGVPPRWLQQSTRSAGVLALLDYGPEVFCFEDRRLIPIGANMAVRRSLIEQVGGFNAALDRSGAALLGQGQAEFFHRCRRAGARGLYVPAMSLGHVVPIARLSVRYFFRWWFWKGVSHARWYRIHGETELGVDLSRASRLFGIPLFVVRGILNDAASACLALVRGRSAEAIDYSCTLAFSAGYIREVWFGPRHLPQGSATAEARPVATKATAR